MVIKWSIVDLQVRGSKRLLAKQIRMKRKFNKGFKLILTGVICILISEILGALLGTVRRIIHKEHADIFSIFQIYNFSHNYILQALSLTLSSLSAIGCFIILFAYMVYGFVTSLLYYGDYSKVKLVIRHIFIINLQILLFDAKQIIYILSIAIV